MTAWHIGMRVRRLGTRMTVVLTDDLGGGNWAGRGPNGEMVAVSQTADWDPVGE